MSNFRDAAQRLFEALRQVGVEHAVGGSFASSIHGISRSTQDIDVVVNLPLAKVEDLHDAIRREFYVDEESMRDAIRRGMSFNVIHFDTGFKFDLFIASRHPIGLEQIAHSASTHTALLGGDPLEVPVISAEDIILAKLLWFKQGGEVSDRQWNDLVNLVSVQKDRADREYLRQQASRLQIAGLLQRLWPE
jgi:hypothetical protein